MTIPQEIADRVRGYLEREAQQLSVEELIGKVRTAVDAVHAAAEGVPAERFDSSPDPGAWSAHECLAHLVGWDLRNAREILYVALSGEVPPEEPVMLSPDRNGLVKAHDEAIESLFAHVREADPSAFLDVTWQHPFFGPLNWREWLLFLEVHCRDHTRQLNAMSVA